LFRRDRLIGCPYHYRDQRTSLGVELVHGVVDPAALYAVNGLQFLDFNTLYQLAVDRDEGLLDDDTRMLMVPDLLAF
jgi:rhamnulokinase